MKKIVSMKTLDSSGCYPTTGFNQTKTVSFNGGYFEIYINKCQDIPNEIIVFQERSALALDYLTYYLNPNIQISLICDDMVIDELEFDFKNDGHKLEFCKDDCQVTFSLETNEVAILSPLSNDPSIFSMSKLEIKWYIRQTNSFYSVDDLLDIIAPYKYSPNDLPDLIKFYKASQTHYFDDWDGILRLIHYYQLRDSFTQQKEMTILPFANFSKPLFDACFRQGEEGVSYFPLFLNDRNSNHFFVDFIVDYILEDIKHKLETIVVVVPYSFLMTFDGEYLFQTIHYIRELIFPRLNFQKLLISYKDDQWNPMDPNKVEWVLNNLRELRVGSSYLLGTYLRDCLYNNNSFEIDSCEPVKSDASFFKKNHAAEINTFKSSNFNDSLDQHNYSLSILNWQHLVTKTLMNHKENVMNRLLISNDKFLKLSEDYSNETVADLRLTYNEKKNLMDRKLKLSEDTWAVSKDINELKQALLIKSYIYQRCLRAEINWLRFYYLILIKKRMLKTFIDRLEIDEVLE